MKLTTVLRENHYGRPRNQGEPSYDVLLHTELINYGINILKKYGANHHDAEDMAYDSLYSTAIAWKKDGGRSIKNYYYLILIGRYKSLKMARHRNTTKKQNSIAFSKHNYTMKEMIVRHDIEWLLKQIPEKGANAAKGVYIDGYTYKEYAKKIRHDSWNSIKSEMILVRSMLRECWKEEINRGYQKEAIV